MKLEWSDNKRASNLGKHGFDFFDAQEVFDDPFGLDIYDVRYSDNRWLLIGRLKSDVVVIAYIEEDDECVRIISMRLATREERENFEDECTRRLEHGGF